MYCFSLFAGAMSTTTTLKIRAKEVVLEWTIGYAHCYDLSCSIEFANGSSVNGVNIRIATRSVVFSGLTPNTSYVANCITASPDESVESREYFTTAGMCQYCPFRKVNCEHQT